MSVSENPLAQLVEEATAVSSPRQKRAFSRLIAIVRERRTSSTDLTVIWNQLRPALPTRNLPLLLWADFTIKTEVVAHHKYANHLLRVRYSPLVSAYPPSP